MSEQKGLLAAILILAITVMFVFSHAFARTSAPTGTYIGKLGASAVSVTARKAGMERLRKRRHVQAPAREQMIKITIDSYSSQAEIDELKAAQDDLQKFMNVLTGFNHGSVEIAGKTYPVNMATSISVQDKYSIYVLSAKPFAGVTVRGRLKGSANPALGTGIGVIRLHVDAAGHGSGKLDTTTQVAVGSDGEVLEQAGVSTQTEIVDIYRQ